MSHLSRRQFLENSMLATAAVALASGPKLSFAEDGDSGEKLRVAVIGVNGRGGSHIAEFGARKDCEIAA
ncbi:MAG TPA: twin-arginine translocation signal domain-containing protein, partial [Schlesneria sp.]